MDTLYAREACCTKLLSGLFLIFLLIFMPFRLWSQNAVQCDEMQSWIARWTIPTITDLISAINVVDKVGDGSQLTYYPTAPGSPWTFDIEFGIIRDFTGLNIYSPSIAYAPHSYEILVRQDNTSPYVSIKTDFLLPFSGVNKEQLIDFGGRYYKSKNVRIKFLDACDVNGVPSNNASLRIYELNFFQCGVDPLIVKSFPLIPAPTPALSCAEGINGNIQEIINSYYPGLADATIGSNIIMVDDARAKKDAHSLVAGDRVLIIQMQNAEISEANTMAYGDGIPNDLIASGWIGEGNTGEYEFAIVESKNGNTIQLTQPLQKKYDARGVFQVIYSPVYKDVTLTGTINAEKWDGYCGGLVTFDAQTLNLNNQTIDVSGQGFRKGKKNSNFHQDPITYYWGTYCTDDTLFFGEKGEGIAGAPRGSYLSNSKLLYSKENLILKSGGSYGRGAPGNAGGGGNDHNSGGGGGGNIGNGGQGGASYGGTQSYSNPGDMTNYWTNITPEKFDRNGNGFFPNGGMGGTGSGTPDPFRIWMGGSGGGGHQNNNAATGGANGGGIILVTARVVIGNGNFYANGENALKTIICQTCDPKITGNDGAGGGGAGGTIVFGFNDQTGSPTINYSAIGGSGGDNSNDNDPHGTGGGGGGGAIIVTAFPSNVVANMKVYGGRNGIHLATLSPWGAHKGLEGQAITSDKLSALYTYSCDHGDAPASFLDAAHQKQPNSDLLGILVDTEPLALNKIPPHDIDALGDAGDDGLDLFKPISTSISDYTVDVMVNDSLNASVNLCGWIDFNGNGKFDENEKAFMPISVSGKQTLTWQIIPSNNIIGGQSYARFRISTGQEALQPTSVAPDGEVEDYPIYINGIPSAVADEVCTHAGLPVKFHVLDNDNLMGDKLGVLTIWTQPLHGSVVVDQNLTPADKTDDFIIYTPTDLVYVGNDSFEYKVCNNVGDCDQAKVTVTINKPISVDFKATPIEGCTPLTVNFSNLSIYETATFNWDFGDNTPPYLGINADHTFTTGETTTIYNVTLRMNTGCGIIETTKQITVNPLPHAVMTERSNEDKPEVVEFEDITIGSISRIWEEDGIQLADTGKILTRTYEHAVIHTIKLIAYNVFDCPNETILSHKTVFRDLYVPNAFMPNSSDTLVNKFKPVGYGVKDYSFMIFDLWGNLIWSTTHFKDGWDGTKNGKPLPNDAYIWRIQAVFENGKVWKGMLKYSNGLLIPGTYRTQGTVTIIR